MPGPKLLGLGAPFFTCRTVSSALHKQVPQPGGFNNRDVPSRGSGEGRPETKLPPELGSAGGLSPPVPPCRPPSCHVLSWQKQRRGEAEIPAVASCKAADSVG